MTFIPNDNIANLNIAPGDRIRLVKPVRTKDGIFTEGHEFVAVNSLHSIYPVQDDEGREISLADIGKPVMWPLYLEVVSRANKE